jgi:hypothetical protein
MVQQPCRHTTIHLYRFKRKSWRVARSIRPAEAAVRKAGSLWTAAGVVGWVADGLRKFGVATVQRPVHTMDA